MMGIAPHAFPGCLSSSNEEELSEDKHGDPGQLNRSPDCKDDGEIVSEYVVADTFRENITCVVLWWG